MLYSTLLVAATAAFSGLVGAQNASFPLPAGIQACCTVDSGRVPDALKGEWCRASQNTCPEICGGQGNIASNGNNCDSKTLQHTCECRNGTKPDLSQYQQTVEGQSCRFWHEQCINATNQDAALQFNCNQIRDERCGNKTSSSAKTSSSSTPSATSSGGSSPSSSSDSSASGTPAPAGSSPAAGAAVHVARNYGTPLLAGGLAAVFGLVL